MVAFVLNAERRNFSRITFQRPATLEIGGAAVSCEVVDISMRGALVRLGGATRFTPGQPCALTVRLDAGIAVIRMQGAVAHRGGDELGIRCVEIDFDSIAHLRRLLELNLADDAMLHRELGALLAAQR